MTMPSGLVALDEDHHVHSTFSDDAVSTVADNVRAARDRGLRVVCLADHVRQGSPWVPDFVAAVRELPPAPDVEVLAGVEAKILNGAGECTGFIAAGEWGPHGVRINAIAPGFLRTPMWDADVARGEIDEAAYIEAVPARRLGLPSDVGQLAVYLAGDSSSYVNGTCITIDGGTTSLPRA